MIYKQNTKLTIIDENEIEGLTDQTSFAEVSLIQHAAAQLNFENFKAQHNIENTIDMPNFKRKFGLTKSLSLSHSSAVVSDILFATGNEPWQLIISALRNKYEWIYLHSVDVALISLLIADFLGYAEERSVRLAIGALFHDVGKILVSKDILEKTTPLTDGEMALIRKHSEYGVDMVGRYLLPQESLDVILQHHERLDGSGYPNGLKSDDIHDFSKIVMLADVLDAITSSRPYRAGQCIDTAIKIVENEGDKFCTECFSAFKMLCRQSA